MSEWGELEGIKITGDPEIPQNKVNIQMKKKQTKVSLKTRWISKLSLMPPFNPCSGRPGLKLASKHPSLMYLYTSKEAQRLIEHAIPKICYLKSSCYQPWPHGSLSKTFRLFGTISSIQPLLDRHTK